MALAGIVAAAIPAGWIALKHVPAEGEESGYWILVKEPADGLSAWWSDEELAKIVANDPDYVKHLETDWSPEDHPGSHAATKPNSWPRSWLIIGAATCPRRTSGLTGR